ncbi:uncharacterized protein E0L32_005579 [Thyridium curvatum]|uniref:Peptidase A1 domain-containing protein n=1 Tax=Thyridium curvatum TaxID=1093900 RepID=A0A507B3F3_9PEZI|nr:uncharacterized protein E0L32_005579 [Thyridium curvatum]TPX14383.1 hypothetical protein E0L32_005579 [Thyridium curvatum]
MRRTLLMVAILGDVLQKAPILADAASAFPLVAGPNWLGIDGSWSTFDVQVGTNTIQTLSLTVSTALSEVWIIENTGCSASPLCTAARGGTFNIYTSNSWQSLGTWELGLPDLAMGGNGDYGMEALAFNNQVDGTGKTLMVDSALVAAINDTSFYTGFIGVGATQGSFGAKVVNPLISQLAESYGEIPSHSYGYTAGAQYVGDKGTPASLVLGGYDANRFVPQSTTFSMAPTTRIPQALIRGIIASVPAIDNAPTKWPSTSQTLLNMNESITATIDTSTPYLWLPGLICDRFANSLGLTWNESFGLYTFKNDKTYNDFLTGTTSLSLTFVLSSIDNMDNFGTPWDTAGVVNITISSKAFALALGYPFNSLIKYGDPRVAYFPLRRANSQTNGGQAVIGRAFMQEAYIITKYDEQVFSLHQALFPNNARTNMSVIDIERSPNSPFPAYTGPSDQGGGLSKGATAGIVVAAFVTGSAIGLILWCCLRKRKRDAKRSTSSHSGDESKDAESSVGSDTPSSPLERIFSFIIKRKKSRKPVAHEVSGDRDQPVEVGADASHQIHELAVPPEPVELDSSNDAGFGDDTTELGTEGSENLSPYEIARRKMFRQLQGPVPTYTATTQEHTHSDEKTEQDVSPVPHYRPGEDASPVSSHSDGHNTSLPNTLPSPMTPRGDWTNRFDLPSPMTVAPPGLSPSFPPGSNSDPSSTYSGRGPPSPLSPRSHDPSSTSGSTSSKDGTNTVPVPPSPVYQRTPIDPSRVICLGPLPENVQLPQHQSSVPSTPRRVDTDGDHINLANRSDEPSEPSPTSPTRRSTDTLGSDFTVDEENHVHGGEATAQTGTRAQEGSTEAANGAGRIDTGSELIHVPQLAHRRYSWEEDR